jgi:hypothetical protein
MGKSIDKVKEEVVATDQKPGAEGKEKLDGKPGKDPAVKTEVKAGDAPVHQDKGAVKDGEGKAGDPNLSKEDMAKAGTNTAPVAQGAGSLGSDKNKAGGDPSLDGAKKVAGGEGAAPAPKGQQAGDPNLAKDDIKPAGTNTAPVKQGEGSLDKDKNKGKEGAPALNKDDVKKVGERKVTEGKIIMISGPRGMADEMDVLQQHGFEGAGVGAGTVEYETTTMGLKQAEALVKRLFGSMASKIDVMEIDLEERKKKVGEGRIPKSTLQDYSQAVQDAATKIAAKYKVSVANKDGWVVAIEHGNLPVDTENALHKEVQALTDEFSHGSVIFKFVEDKGLVGIMVHPDTQKQVDEEGKVGEGKVPENPAGEVDDKMITTLIEKGDNSRLRVYTETHLDPMELIRKGAEAEGVVEERVPSVTEREADDSFERMIGKVR